MVKHRHSFSMPTYRPRRIWLNSVGAQNGSVDESALRKSLPYCDLETGTKNRVVNRDPISGLGLLGKEYSPLQENRTRPKSARDTPNANPILGTGELGEELNIFSVPKKISCKQRQYRNPLVTESCNKDGKESDKLRPRGKPTKQSIRQAQRDPISGRGEFGKEWDPIYGYSGRPRPWHAQPRDDRNPITSSGLSTAEVLDLWRKPQDYHLRAYLDGKPLLRRTQSLNVESIRGGKGNPVTGEDVKSFDINTEMRRTPRRDPKAKSSNPVTGDNCESFVVSETLNEKRLKAGAKPQTSKSNPVTGDNVKSFEISVESRPKTPRKVEGGNPVTGDNCKVFSYGKEFKPKTPRNNSDANPLTGNNCKSYTYSTEDRPKTANGTVATPRSNPVTGENCNHFVLNSQEKRPATARAYIESNPLTGSNTKSFDIDREMRVNRRPSNGSVASSKSVESNGPVRAPASTNGSNSPAKSTSSYNPITGESRP